MSSDAPLPERGPGLAKTRPGRLFSRRAVELWASTPGAMADFVRSADVVSEGAVTAENGASAYYGSTSLLFLPGPRTQALSTGELCAHLAADPHVRLLALRIAVREAAHRAGPAMGQVSADIAFREDPRGVLVTVDLAAPIATTRPLAATGNGR
jgi:hypothetical protein